MTEALYWYTNTIPMGLKKTFQMQKKASLSEKAYRQIKAAIIANELQPNTSISEYWLAEVLAMSRTPIREALGRLEAEGFVGNLSGRGAVVRPVTAELALEVFEYREAVEGLACRLAAIRMEESTRAHLVQIFLHESAPPGIEGLNKISGTLHTAIRDACGNAMLQSSLDRIRDHLSRLRTVATEIPGRIEQSYVEHQPIVETLARRDEEQAEMTMRQHLVSAKNSLFEALFENRLGLRRRGATSGDGQGGNGVSAT